ncbi:hypothetical protein [Paenibacillus thiaminolyticus]|uniref:hypothetical protein n=1 Tax=Paenibacillus thiaminolyticus TaxID=49283 RepID=UPI0016043A0C|nr:hypothetical protein [Paenibacillus thiaminolyticus]
MGHAHTIAANWPDGLPSRRAPPPGDKAREQLLPERLFLFQAGDILTSLRDIFVLLVIT